jgi:hypothetical protein
MALGFLPGSDGVFSDESGEPKFDRHSAANGGALSAKTSCARKQAARAKPELFAPLGMTNLASDGTA